MKNFKTYKDFKVDESVTRSKEKFSVIVKNTGEIIDDGLPKDLALKLAAKKNGWVIKKVDKSITEKFMDSQIDQIAQAEFGMDYDQLGKGEKEWVRDEIDNMTESVNEGLPPGYSKFLVSLQTLIGDIAPNAWGNKSQITPSSVKRVHNSLKKRYGDDYAKFNDLLKTQKGQFGNWYLKESVNEAKAEPIVDLLDQGKWANVGMGEKKLVKLSDAFDTIGDEQADAIASHLNMAIELMQEREKKSAVPHMNKFNKACEQELKLMKKQGLAESVTEAAPRITNSKETEALLELRDRVANSSKGGSSRYSKEFDKAKTTALRAIEQMLTYTKIGV